MLIARATGQAPRGLVEAGHAMIETPIWLDLFLPTDQDAATASEITGLRIPSRADLDEIESSSRLFREGTTLYLSTPLVRRQDGVSAITPLGLIVSAQYLVSIRYADYPAIENYGKLVACASDDRGVAGLLIGLLEAIVDRIADVLEIVGAELDQMSRGVFRSGSHDHSKDADRRLRKLLKDIGRQGDSVSMLRDSMLGLRRLVLFVEAALGSDDPDHKGRLETLGRDLQSLAEYDGQLTEKVHFLLDATLGLINVEQNTGIRILTVVSLIGIPPTLIASIYGMNFKDIPELNWAFGYWYALGLMLASVVAPLAWFRRAGWI